MDAALHEYYALGAERDRLGHGAGALEWERTTEIIARHIPREPSIVADIGGGPGRYAVWLATHGHRVHHRDIVELHVEQAAEEARAAACASAIDTRVRDACDLDLDDTSVDAVLLLGPLYHLDRRRDRVRALTEARRVVRPGGVVVAAAISRWAGRLHAVLAERLYLTVPGALEALPESERDGRLRPLFPGSFTGNSHRPTQLAAEVRASGLELVELVNVEGPAALLPDLDRRLADPVDRAVVLDTARAVESVPELLGCGPHLIAVGRRVDRS